MIVKMLFLFVLFSLVSLCDPLPRTSGGLVTTAMSHESPLLTKNSWNSYYRHREQNITLMARLNQKEINNGTHQSLQKNVTPTNHQSPPSQKNLYLLPVEPSTHTQVYSQHNQEIELPPEVSAEVGDGQVTIENFYFYVPGEDEETTQSLETELPLLKFNREYTPYEIAEYIFVTEDEKGFVQGVAEMIEDGQIMASMDDAILYLEAVQEKLDKLRQDQENTSDHKMTAKV